MNKLKVAVLFLALGFNLTPNAESASQGVPARVTLGSSPTLSDRKAPRDANELLFPGGHADAGWLVFESSGSSLQYLINDNSSTTVSCGILHNLCIEGVGSVVVFDSAAAGGFTAGASAGKLAPTLNAAVNGNGMTCWPSPLDVQWNRGAVVVNSSGSATTYAYFRPCSSKPGR